MFSDSELKSLAIQSGLSKQEIYDVYHKSVVEAEALGKDNDKSFVLEIMKSFAGLDEEDKNKTIQRINSQFIESGFKDFDEFLESIWNDVQEDIVSTNFSPAVRPEHNLGHAVKFPPEDIDDDEEIQ